MEPSLKIVHICEHIENVFAEKRKKHPQKLLPCVQKISENGRGAQNVFWIFVDEATHFFSCVARGRVELWRAPYLLMSAIPHGSRQNLPNKA